MECEGDACDKRTVKGRVELGAERGGENPGEDCQWEQGKTAHEPEGETSHVVLRAYPIAARPTRARL